MADFALWATAAEPALGWQDGAFVAAYAGNRAEANDLALDGSPLTCPLRELAESAQWEGTCADLLDKLSQAAAEDATRAKSWPKTPRALSGQLRRLAPNLRRAGVTVELYRESSSKRQRMVRIVKNTQASDRPNRPNRPNDLFSPVNAPDGSRTVGIGDHPAQESANNHAPDGSDGPDG
jgi:hypothetical protein